MLTLYTRRACPLCEAMAGRVRAAAPGVGLAEVDVDTDPALRERYGWDVPLLFDGDTELFRHVFEPARFTAWLAAQTAT